MYLKAKGYDGIPVRPDGISVGGLPTYAALAEVTGPIDLVVIFRRPEAVPRHIDEAAAKHVEVVWLQSGVWSAAAEIAAHRHALTLVKEPLRCRRAPPRVAACRPSDEGGRSRAPAETDVRR